MGIDERIGTAEKRVEHEGGIDEQDEQIARASVRGEAVVRRGERGNP